MLSKFKMLFMFVTTLVTACIAMARDYEEPTLTYDLGGAAGTYVGKSYTEINLGLNWKLTEYFVWRNAVFARMINGGENLYGLDTTARFQHKVSSDDGRFGLGFFGGPGYRFSKANASAFFAEGGVEIKLGGIHLGGGVKYFNYPNPGTDSTGAKLPSDDTVYFLILSGGGAL